MTDRKRLNRRIPVDDRFDEDEPVARMIRDVLPGDEPMAEVSRERMMGHLLSVQRKRQQPEPARRFAYKALVPAMAVILVLAVAAAVTLPLALRTPRASKTVGARAATLAEITGQVQVRSPGSNWRAVRPHDRPAAGWGVRTAASSLASLRFPDRSIARLTAGSEAKVLAVSSGSVALEHVSGGTYHRVHKGTRYTVEHQGVTSRALGTAFSIDSSKAGTLQILTVENSVQVTIGSHDPITVSQGEVMTVSMDAEMKADKQPVSREMLEQPSLVASVQQDAAAGYSTGVYSNLDVPVVQPPPPPQIPEEPPTVIQLAGDLTDSEATLSWTITGETVFSQLVLLRSETAEPEYPGDEVASYSDTSISSGTDDTIQAGHTYQYRIAGISADSGAVTYSNTIVVDVPARQPQPVPVSVSLTAEQTGGGVAVQWSVTGGGVFTGFVLERVVEKAPDGSTTPAGTTWSKNIDSSDVFYSYVDGGVTRGHTYNYRVGLVVDGSVMSYSPWTTVEVK